ncbi:hypothetical protein [Bounagaea algeriensis]
MTRSVLRGAAAGAAGTTALNLATYADMAVRGRPASTTPEETVRRLERFSGCSLDRAGSEVGGNRRSGLGALLGIASGVAAGGLTGLVRHCCGTGPVSTAVVAGVAANAGTVVPMAAMGVSDPREWSLDSWVSDLVPHAVYACATAAVLGQWQRRSCPAR